MNSLHISQVRKMLDTGQPLNLRLVKLRDGSLYEANKAVSLTHDFYKGTRTIKCLTSGRKITIHDVCIVGVNEYEVFL